MILVLLIGLALTATAVVLVTRGLIAARLRAENSLASIDSYGFAGGVDRRRAQGLKETVEDVAGAIGNLILRNLRFGKEENIRATLVSAGMYRLTPRMLMGYQVLGAVLLPAAWIWLAIGAGSSAK